LMILPWTGGGSLQPKLREGPPARTWVLRSSVENRRIENPASVPNSIMPVYEHFASDKRRGAAARALKPDGLSTRLMVGGCRPLFFHWICAPSWGGFLPGLFAEADRRGRKATER